MIYETHTNRYVYDLTCSAWSIEYSGCCSSIPDKNVLVLVHRRVVIIADADADADIDVIVEAVLCFCFLIRRYQKASCCFVIAAVVGFVLMMLLWDFV